MRKLLCAGLMFLTALCGGGDSLRAQSAREAPAGGDSDYVTRRGANEFGAWSGG